MWIKICGTTSVEDAQLAINAGADSVGFVFAESKRKVTPGHVAGITRELPHHVERTGVFHTHSVEDIIAAAREAGLTSVQIHRRFDPEEVSALRAGLGRDVKLIQVITCSVENLDSQSLRSELRSALTEPDLWGVLLDASKAGVTGGTGASFDWVKVAAVLDEVWQERGNGHGAQLILAGGLRPENVREAIATLRPAGVDVVSGVEAEPGKKDAALVKAFVEAARRT